MYGCVIAFRLKNMNDNYEYSNMKLDCVLTAVNENPLYIDFVPYFVKTWNKLYPDVDVKIVLIAHAIPESLREFSSNIILFSPIEGMSTAFISQYIRLLYPALLPYTNGVMISDMDMIPMSRTYYTEPIKNIERDKFVYFRGNVLLDGKEIAMCYNTATPGTWGEVFRIKTVDDIIQRLQEVNRKIHYVDGHGKEGWSTDQNDFYTEVMKWNSEARRLICLRDSEIGFRRLDRHKFVLNQSLKDAIRKGVFTDYHCLRPFKQFEAVNIAIYDAL